jgi:hypothetical protein
MTYLRSSVRLKFTSLTRLMKTPKLLQSVTPPEKSKKPGDCQQTILDCSVSRRVVVSENNSMLILDITKGK